MGRILSFAGNTNLGMVRSNNEDAFLVQNVWDENHVLAVAIDGVGGYEGGEVAAAIARDSIAQFLATNCDGEKSELLRRAVIYANNNIYEQRQRSTEYANMSCVLTAALIDAEEQFVNMAHVGDTRLYQYNNGEFVKLSHDHSLVGYREEVGDLTEEEAMHHPQRNIISRDVGSRYLQDSEDEYVEVDSFPLIPESVFMLCSDGLCDMITSGEMVSVLVSDIPAADKVEQLIAKANAAGGRDNVTVVVVEYFPDVTDSDMSPVNEEIVNEEDTEDPVVAVYSLPKKSFFAKYKVEIVGSVVALLVLLLFAGLKYYGVISGGGNDCAAAEEEVVVAPLFEETTLLDESVNGEETADEESEGEGSEIGVDPVDVDEEMDETDGDLSENQPLF